METNLEQVTKVAKSCEENTQPPTTYHIFTSDAKEADKYQMYTKIITKGRKTLYTMWNVFRSIEYFENIVNSSMAESRSREITFDHLTLAESKEYLELLFSISLTKGKFVWKGSLFSLYDQADYHQIDNITVECLQRMYMLPYTEELYKWNKKRELISQKDMIEKLYFALDQFRSDNNDHLLSTYIPIEDKDFIKESLKYCSAREGVKRNIMIDWIIIAKVDAEDVAEYLEYCTTCTSQYSSIHIWNIAESVQSDDNMYMTHRDPFIMNFLKLAAINCRDLILKQHNIKNNKH